MILLWRHSKFSSLQLFSEKLFLYSSHLPEISNGDKIDQLCRIQLITSIWLQHLISFLTNGSSLKLPWWLCLWFLVCRSINVVSLASMKAESNYEPAIAWIWSSRVKLLISCRLKCCPAMVSVGTLKKPQPLFWSSDLGQPHLSLINIQKSCRIHASCSIYPHLKRIFIIFMNILFTFLLNLDHLAHSFFPTDGFVFIFRC